MIPLLIIRAASADAFIGSYGRVGVSADATGGQGDAVNVVSWGSRLEKPPYLELDLGFDERLEDGARFRVVVTPAVSGDLFHYTGQWTADLTLRNLYAEADAFVDAPLSVWAGSRIYRGDDVYLLDFWPMDMLNTVGGGASWHPEGLAVDLHAGLSRLEGEDATGEAWQHQETEAVEAGGVGTESILVLDRQRLVGSGRLTWSGSDLGRIRLYGEVHRLPEGQRLTDEYSEETLPADRGSVLGTQLSLWSPGGFTHLWLRYATGLGTIGDLGIPTDGIATDQTFAGAREGRLALASNHDGDTLGVMVGGYLRRFTDADADIGTDVDDRWEANIAVRPGVTLSEHVRLAAEISHQWLRPDGLNPRTAAHAIPQVTRLAALPTVQIAPGGFSRPHIQLQYIYSHLNNDARAWYAEDDVRHRSNHQHFIGVNAEWWLNSATYPR